MVNGKRWDQNGVDAGIGFQLALINTEFAQNQNKTPVNFDQIFTFNLSNAIEK